ncbi:TLC domain-containing protein [Pelagophyceae sp. CCMP2097]|nr:TLC domain-containing protein [Pelagophyceae sp. CCMP2097]|mmetsp:Transcript_2277/g.6812  ORF Transcript_2277/g.6812 Transcript_2277/m.6812 type:complete len:319 (+) Transcript_2277:74-1030(+)
MAAVFVELRLQLGALGLRLAGGDVPASTPTENDLGVAAVYCIALFLLNWVARLYVVAPAARAVLRAPQGRLSARALEAKVTKFAQAAMEAAFYGGFTALGLCVVPRQPWIWPSSQWWAGFSGGDHAVMGTDLRCYYLLYGARYAQGMASVALEPRRKDYFEMQVHHAVTVAVVFISYRHGWHRIGAVVMLLLDPADVPLHCAKMLKYVADARQGQGALARWCTFGADRTFEVFAVVFFVTRVVAYPYVCWSAHVEATRYFPKGAPEWACVALLETLYALQVYWFFLIVKVAVKMAHTGNAEDVRSDDDDDGTPRKKKQ